MKNEKWRAIYILHFTFFIQAAVSSSLQLPAGEDVARRRLDSGRAFASAGRYDEALKDFRAVVDTHGDTSVADDALLEIARYYFAVAGDRAQAETAADTLLKRYPTGNAAPAAHLLIGRVAFDRSRRRADLEAAVASFDRVSRLFPDADVVPEGLFFAGEALRLRGAFDESLDRYLRVADYADTEWGGRALLGAAMALAASGEHAGALELLQQTRRRRPDAPEAVSALRRATVLFRLHLRAKGSPAFSFNPQGLEAAPAKLVNVMALTATPDGRLYYAMESGVGVTGVPGGSRLAPASQPRGFVVDRAGRVLVLDGATLRPPDGRPMAMAVPRDGGGTRPLQEIVAAVETGAGDWLIAEKDTRAIHRFSRDARHLGVFAPTRAARLAINDGDEVAAIDADSRAVMVFDAEGRTLARIPARGTGYLMQRPTDLAFDAFGHLYVLDRESGVTVFDRGQTLLTAYTPAEKAPGAFRRATAMAVDAFGRLFIFDERAQRILVHQ